MIELDRLDFYKNSVNYKVYIIYQKRKNGIENWINFMLIFDYFYAVNIIIM